VQVPAKPVIAMSSPVSSSTSQTAASGSDEVSSMPPPGRARMPLSRRGCSRCDRSCWGRGRRRRLPCCWAWARWGSRSARCSCHRQPFGTGLAVPNCVGLHRRCRTPAAITAALEIRVFARYHRSSRGSSSDGSMTRAVRRARGARIPQGDRSPAAVRSSHVSSLSGVTGVSETASVRRLKSTKVHDRSHISAAILGSWGRIISAWMRGILRSTSSLLPSI
jgi:hypothetical protein